MKGTDDKQQQQEARKDKNRITIELILLLIGYVGIFITTVIWWSRLYPWFGHGKKDGKSVYQSLYACWILALIGGCFTGFLLISNVCIEKICLPMVNKFHILMVIFALESCLSLGVIISGLYEVTFALKNPKFGDNLNDNRCLKYIANGFTGASLWAIQNHKIEDYVKWSNDLAKHSQNENGVYNGYLCVNVGASTLTFVIVHFIALVVAMVISWKMQVPGFKT